MKKIIILSIVLFVAFTIKVSAQNKRVYTSSNSSTITIGTPANRTVYGGTIINSMYHGNLINPKIKGMFEYACKLWEENIPTAYPINLDVRFENLPDGCLAKVTTEPADSIYHDKVFIKRYKQLYSIEKTVLIA